MKPLTDIKQDFPGWYQDAIFQAELVDSSPTRGCMVIRPYGYAIWENIQKVLDKKIKALGAQNAYFPLLIPESFLKKEAEHVEGFAPEVAVVTHAGGKKLEEPFVIRPTSETIIYYMFSQWIRSWRDLPLKINQWANVIRWEMRPRAFLRTGEFLWHEGHTAHATHEEALEMTLAEQKMYKEFVEHYLAVPVISGQKTETERFAGAERTYCIEALMQDGKSVQMGTTHLLAHSFPASFDISFQDKDGSKKVPYCTSFGVSTRLIGGLVMTHGDDKGLVLPPRIAPIQVAIIPIYKNDESKAAVLDAVNTLKTDLEKRDIRVVIDDDETKTPGAKFFHWELRGVPLRVEIGPKDLENKTVALVSRIEMEKKKLFIPATEAVDGIEKMLNTIQNELFARAKTRTEKMVQDGRKLEEFKKSLDEENGVFLAGWCGSKNCEASLKEYKGSIRCMVNTKKQRECFCCTQESISDVIIAKSY